MLGIKTKIITKLESYLYENKINQHKKSIVLKKLLQMLLKAKLSSSYYQNPSQIPGLKHTNRIASAFTKTTANFMPNNLGNWSIAPPHSLSTHLEKEIVTYVKRKLNCGDEIIGHFGSGSTEGNIYATWIGKKFLQKKLHDDDLKKIIMLKSSIAHYSLIKAADINEVRIEELPIKIPDHVIDEKALLLKMEQLYKKGIRGFLLPLTIGYTIFGTEDDYQKICSLTKQFTNTHKNSFVFVWLDAAFNGVLKMYLDEKFQPFTEKEIYLISTDFHKTIGTPYPSNIILYKKNLLKLIAHPIPYINQKDTTLLGSRPGNSITSTWMTLLLLGEKFIAKKLNMAVQEKNRYIHNLKKQNKNIEIITGKNSIQMAIISKKYNKIPNNLKSDSVSIIHKGKNKIIKVAKLYFFPKL